MRITITNWYKKLKEKIRQSGFLGFDETVKEVNLSKNYHLFRTPGRNSNSNLPACLQGTDDAFDRDAYLEELCPDLERIVTIQNETERCCYHKIQNMIIARGGRPTTEEEKHWIEDVVVENEWKYISTQEWQVEIREKYGDDCGLSEANAYRIATSGFGQETLREVKMEERKWIEDVVEANKSKYISRKDWQAKIIENYGMDYALTAGNAYRIATKAFGQKTFREVKMEERQWIEGIVKANAGERISCNEWQAKIIENYGMDYALTAGNAYQMALKSGMKRLRVLVTDDHREYISNKVEELNKNKEQRGEEEWNEGICSKFEEDNRIAGVTAYQIALGCGMKRKYAEVDYDGYIHNKVKELNKKKEYWGEKEWNDDICSKFEENDRIAGSTAYKIALRYGMKRKQKYAVVMDHHRDFIKKNVIGTKRDGQVRESGMMVFAQNSKRMIELLGKGHTKLHLNPIVAAMRFSSVLVLLALTANGVESKKVKKKKVSHTSHTTTTTHTYSKGKSDKATKAPSVKATKAPSVKVSKPPSVKASKCSKSSKSSKSCKSEAPSQLPSETPSVSMSPSLSSAPSDIPSDAPSEFPSTSVSPSSLPSDSPSSVPSDIPSDAPSEFPSTSVAPSVIPSDMPSVIPSVSISPSSEPSVSLEPSYKPTKSGKSSKSKKSSKGTKTPTVSVKGSKSYKSAKQVELRFDTTNYLCLDLSLESNQNNCSSTTKWLYNGKYLHDGDQYLTIDGSGDPALTGADPNLKRIKWDTAVYGDNDDCQILYEYTKSTKSSSGTKNLLCDVAGVLKLEPWDGVGIPASNCCLQVIYLT